MSCRRWVQGVDDISTDIEAASLRALAAHSRLNSTLASVYAKTSAPQEAAAEAVPAAETAALMAGVQNLPLPVPAESAPRGKRMGASVAADAQLPDVSAPGQQRSASPAKTAAHQHGAAQKEEESLLNKVTLTDILQGVSHHASASQLDWIWRTACVCQWLIIIKSIASSRDS